MRIDELIKGWKHAGRDISASRAARAEDAKSVKLVSLRKDGEESGMHDAASKHDSVEAALAYHQRLVDLNPKRRIAHNMYVNNQFDKALIGKLDEAISHLTGARAERATGSQKTDAAQQHKFVQRWQQIDALIKEIGEKPDAHTGKYAAQLNRLEKQKTDAATKGGLNAMGQPLEESATSGSTSSGAVATMANPFGVVMRQPSLFGYVPQKTSPKKVKNKSNHK
jgi:hypothetical protein